MLKTVFDIVKNLIFLAIDLIKFNYLHLFFIKYLFKLFRHNDKHIF